MSDFLTRLAERTLGQAHLVEPALPALWDTSAWTDGDDLTAEPTSTFAAAPAVSPLPTVPPTVSMSAIATTHARGASPRPSEASPGTVRPSRTERGAGAGSIEEPSTRRASASPVPGAVEPSVIRERTERVERVEVRPAAALPHEPRRAAPRPQPERVPALLPLTPRNIEAAEVLRPVAPAVMAPTPVQPRVEITIGRIDVRATSKPAVARRPRRGATEAAPRLSLTDYLAVRPGDGARTGGRP